MVNLIESINQALLTFKIHIKSSYIFIFSESNITYEKYEMKLNFTRNVIGSCGHIPSLLKIKNEKNQYLAKNGKYTIQCNRCPLKHRWLDINNFH